MSIFEIRKSDRGPGKARPPRIKGGGRGTPTSGGGSSGGGWWPPCLIWMAAPLLLLTLSLLATGVMP